MALQLLLSGWFLAGSSIVRMRPMNNIRVRRIVLFLTLLIVVSEYVRSTKGLYCVVEGQSMYPTFSHDDVVQTRAPNGSPRRGDVVIITDDRGDRVIKRIIGLPGESVTLFLGFVYINGQRLSEPYLLRHTYTFKSDTEDERAADWRLRDRQFFVLGDNRLQSIDSRNFGPVERRGILRVVDLPENSFRPGFCDIILSESGKPMRKSQMQHEGSL
jgi:signal peptidase I